MVSRWLICLQSHLFSIYSFQRFSAFKWFCCKAGSCITMCQQWHGTRNLKFFGTLQWTVLLLEQFSSSLSTLHAETFFRWERITELEYSGQICSFPFSLLFLIVGFFCMCAKHVLAQVLYLSLDSFFFKVSCCMFQWVWWSFSTSASEGWKPAYPEIRADFPIMSSEKKEETCLVWQ